MLVSVGHFLTDIYPISEHDSETNKEIHCLTEYS